MNRPRGRPADEKHRRMARMLRSLITHPRIGSTRDELIAAAGSDPSDASDVRKFRRDIKELRAAGWHIDSPSFGPFGGMYRLHVVDNRIRATFSDPQRAQLLRAAERAGLGQLYEDLSPGTPDGRSAEAGPANLGTAEHAIRRRCVVTFEYSGRERRVHPYDVFLSSDDWFLRGREEGTDQPFKTFRLSRAEGLLAEPPGTADDLQELPAPNRDPMLLAVCEPFPVVVATTEADLPDVISALGANGHQVLSPESDSDEIQVEVVVTNPPALLARVVELGSRVRLIGPESIRVLARDLLTSAAGRSS